MKVIARKGVKVPMEGKIRQYVTDAEAVEVPATTYYIRRQLDGDLLLADSQATPNASNPPVVAPVAPAADASRAAVAASATASTATEPTDTPVGDKKTTKGV